MAPTLKADTTMQSNIKQEVTVPSNNNNKLSSAATATEAADATAMQTKISSLELGSQLQVKHLESISAQEASLRQVWPLLVYAR